MFTPKENEAAQKLYEIMLELGLSKKTAELWVTAILDSARTATEKKNAKL